ncbi:MAG TPA: hypothetical protein VK327_09320, partial [Candidatus Paceibacterota bacterium]|nr:hypothetical protein [Candidatus Paceibacterota bacterium]
VPKNNGKQWVEAEAVLPDGRRVFAAAEFNADSPNLVWFDDALPAGAVPGSLGGDSWDWVGSPVQSGTKAHQSASVAGLHQHDFDWAQSTLTVATGTVLYAYAYLDPANPPTAIELQWNDGTWEHRAFWGADVIPWGTSGTPGRQNMGALPAPGKWIQLQVPASRVGLEGSVVKGMGFSTYNGHVNWDVAGLLNPSVTNSAPGTNNPGTGGGSTNTNSSLPVVAVAAQNGSMVGNQPGAFTFTRTGDTSSNLVVVYSLSGTAASGIDYVAPSAAPANAIIAVPSVTIPAGSTSATLNIAPTSSTNISDSKTIVATVAVNTGYTVAAPGTATVTIAGNTVSKPALKMSAVGPTLTWSSTAGAVYRIAFKNSLADPAWTYLPNTVSSTSALTSWTDNDKKPQRFYLIIRVQ